jgi:hypothetical protein
MLVLFRTPIQLVKNTAFGLIDKMTIFLKSRSARACRERCHASTKRAKTLLSGWRLHKPWREPISESMNGVHFIVEIPALENRWRTLADEPLGAV